MHLKKIIFENCCHLILESVGKVQLNIHCTFVCIDALHPKINNFSVILECFLSTWVEPELSRGYSGTQHSAYRES